MVYGLTGAFILLDLLTGMIKAFKEQNYSSTIMREGLYHKIGSVLCVLFAVLVDYTQGYLDLGITIPLTVAVCGYIVVMEIGSIIENVCTINPEILPHEMKKYFSKLSAGEGNEQHEG